MTRSIHITKDLQVQEEYLWVIGAGIVIAGAIGFWWWGARTAGTATLMQHDQAMVQAVPETAADTLPALTAPRSPALAMNVNTVVSTDIASVVSHIPEASSFGELFQSTGVAASLKGGPFTVFVSSNKALSELPQGTLNSMSAAEKKRFVEYHVIGDRKVDIGAMRAGSLQALSKDGLNFMVMASDGIGRVNGTAVVKTYQADNGIIYLIDSALLPPLKSQ